MPPETGGPPRAVHEGARIHPTAIVEEGVSIGAGTSVWDHAHVRHSTVIGRDCIVGGKTYVAYDVEIGDRVKVNAFVYLCTAVTLENGVMIGASTTFTNDRFPRATTPDLARLRDSGPDEHTLATLVREGATVGAASTIGPGVTIGRFAMVGMGSVVTRDVPDFHLVVGSPARSVGGVCRCGEVVVRFGGDSQEVVNRRCGSCGRGYRVDGQEIVELSPAD